MNRISLQAIQQQIQQHFWLILSLSIPLYFGIVSLHYALSQDYIVQDDARIHIVWLQQFIDPQLFPNDLFAQYYQSIQSMGFKWLYWLAAKLGVAPLLFAKLLPTLLGLLTTLYCFRLVLQLIPIPVAAFLSALILNQNIWLKDDLISATPRSFAYLLFIAFLYYLLKRSLIPCLLVIALQGVFYPQLLFVEIGVLYLRLFYWQGRSLQLSHNKSDYKFAIAGTVIVIIASIVFAANASQFGALATVKQMQTMPEFALNGRREYFGVDPISFWFRGASGLRFPLFPPIIWLSVGLPILLNAKLSVNKFLTGEIRILPQVFFASLDMFGLAHLLFPKLYLPSRYTFYSFRIIMSIAAGIVISALLHCGYRWLQNKKQSQTKLTLREQILVGFCGLFAVAAIVTPAVPALFLDCQNWIVGKTPQLYQFLAQTPEDSLIASLAETANNIPAFSRRSVLVNQELALPYHPVFYAEVQQRIVDLLHLQYSPDLSETKAILQNYGIDFLILEDRSFAPDYLLQQDWLMHSAVNPIVSETIAQLQQGTRPALVPYVDRCSVFSENNLTVLDAACINSIESE